MTSQSPSSMQVRDAWDGVADGFDRHTTPHTIALGAEVVSRLPIGPDTRVLDVAAGSGALSIPSARAGADVVAVDIAPTMVDRLVARAEAAGLTVSAMVADGTALGLDDGTFDVTMSMNGISLFGDLTAGLQEARRVTRPGGRVAIVTFAPLPQVEFISFFLGAVQTVGGDAVPMPTGPLPPFRLADPDVFASTLEQAGLGEVTVETVAWSTSFASVDDLLDVVLSSNPIAGRLMGGLDDAQRTEVREVLDRMLRERAAGADHAVLHNRLHIGHGTA